VEHVARDVISGIWEVKWEVVSKFEFHLCIFLFEKLLECSAFNVVSHGSHDGSRE
jgi:hypothetical protein